ncbi:MAG: alpha/beta fold hydrolase [Desulfobacterales bacterium]|nr:alpha/beta fold hydrolase [Desulfobacterales bacterium]
MKRRAIFLIAGWAHTERALHPVASALQEAAYDVRVESTWRLLNRLGNVPWQGPSQGESSVRKKNSGLSYYAKGLRQILEKQGAPCIVVGWSAGGMVAMEVAVEHPELLERLVLIGATARLCADNGYPCGVAAGNVRAMILDMKKNPMAVLDRFFQDVSWPAVESEWLRNKKVKAAHNMGIEPLVDGLRYLQKTDLRDKLKGVKIPALIIHGRDDRIVPWQAGQWLNDSLPDSRIIIHEGVGHDIDGRQSAVLASEIIEFMEDNNLTV